MFSKPRIQITDGHLRDTSLSGVPLVFKCNRIPVVMDRCACTVEFALEIQKVDLRPYQIQNSSLRDKQS